MASKGNCYLCGAERGKAAMKNHILKAHGGEGAGQECRLLRIEGADDKDYWLYVDMPVDKTLDALDRFLRKIWLECCGHLSEFQGASKNSKIGRFSVGDQFLHLYDMGSTTETLITVMGTTWRKPQREIVRLLARNAAPQLRCANCGASADFICVECSWDSDNPFYCEKCAKKHEHKEMLLPVTNSPRMGVCGYCGELDTFAFVPPEGARASVTPKGSGKALGKQRGKGAVNAPGEASGKESGKQHGRETVWEPEKRETPKSGGTGLYPDELYELAFAFRCAKPWRRLCEDELFAIPLPNGETGYCSVMGLAGEHFALVVFPGERGLRSFQRIQAFEESVQWSMMPPNPLKMQEQMLSQFCIQCSLENKNLLLPEELASARGYAASHDIKLRGSNAFPKFVSYRPASFPRLLTSEEDIRILSDALRGALAVNEKLLNAERVVSEKKALGFSGGLAAGRSLPVLTPGRDGFTWGTGMLPDVLPPDDPRPVLRDDVLLTRLKRAKKRNTAWVCDVVLCPKPVQEEESDTPVFPYMLLAADKKTETALLSSLVCDYEHEAETLLCRLGEQMLKSGVPRKIIVTDDRTQALLETFTGSLGIELARSDTDELLEDLETAFAGYAEADELAEEDAAELAANILMTADDAELLRLPQPAWDGLRSAINGGDVSAEAKDRFYELDEKRRRH